jgi:hypothetical protein
VEWPGKKGTRTGNKIKTVFNFKMTRQARLKSKGPSQTRKSFTSYKVNFHLIWSPQGCHRGVVNSKKYPYTPVFLMKKYGKIYFYLNIRTPKSWVDYPSDAMAGVRVIGLLYL